jgi:hypothetical protein
MNAPLPGRGRISPAPAACTRFRSSRGPVLATRPPWRMRLPTALWPMFLDLISWCSLIAVEVEFRAIIAVHACTLSSLKERLHDPTPTQKPVWAGPRHMRPKLVAVMSVGGQSRPKWTVRATSAFPPIATELRTSLEVRFVPEADIEHRRAGQKKDRWKAALSALLIRP